MICKGVVVLQKTLLSRFYKCLSVQFGKARNPFVLQCLFIFYSQTFMKIKKCLKILFANFLQVFWLDSQTFVTSINVQQNFPSQTFLMSTVVFIIDNFQKVQIRVFIFILPTHQVSIKFHILVENFHKIWVEFSFVSYAFRQYCWIWGFVYVFDGSSLFQCRISLNWRKSWYRFLIQRVLIDHLRLGIEYQQVSVFNI
eukprot:TRINITY_DN11518_c0_g1_i2.p1 TRINITY_DN11518_c0_g1~~TRINITY_DN11518_c0_g1_i2.p1  ORF type:complete len:198 (+),score=-4.82 TRINITY_DN11518_c0_g1_i2:1-594(+)